MAYEHNIKNNVITIEDENFHNLPWGVELSLPSLHHVEYIQAHLSFFYKNKEDAEKAIQICDRRKFLVEKKGMTYNRKEDCYSVVIICELTWDQITPRCNKTWEQAIYN